MKRVFPESHSLFLKLVLSVGTMLFVSMGFFALFSINYVKESILNNVTEEADRFSTTILLGTRYTMMNNVRENVTQIINNIARQEDVKHIRIFRKEGHIVFSNREEELGSVANINDYACAICHKIDPPPYSLDLEDRTRLISSPDGRRFLGIVNPIYNEPGCSSASCHAHSPDTTILGILDVVISLDKVDGEIFLLKRIYSGLAIVSFIVTSLLIFFYLNRFVSRPVKKMIAGTEMIANGKDFNPDSIKRNDEMGQLASAISSMGQKITTQREALKKSNDELFTLNQELEKLSTTDALTGLANRRFLLESFSLEYERAKRYNHNLAVLMVDVDYFKKVNDEYGHTCGDTALKELSDTLKETVRGADLVARYGGEEIVILLPETDSKQAYIIAEKLRYKVESNTILCEEHSFSITVSIGLATYPEIHSSTPTQLLNAADEAMYRAKREGRNKVVSYAGEDFLPER